MGGVVIVNAVKGLSILERVVYASDVDLVSDA